MLRLATFVLCFIHRVTFLLQYLAVVLHVVCLNIMPPRRSVRRKADSNSHQPPPRRVVRQKLSFSGPPLPYISSGLPKRKCMKSSFELDFFWFAGVPSARSCSLFLVVT